MGEIRASADESEPLVVTCVKMCMVQRKMELRDRVKDGQNDDKGDLKLVPCSKKSRAEDGSSRAHAACFEALINAGADVDQWDGEGLAPIHHAAKSGDAGCVRFLCGLGPVSSFFERRGDGVPSARAPHTPSPRVTWSTQVWTRTPTSSSVMSGGYDLYI